MDRSIIATTGQQASVPAERHTTHLAGVSPQRRQQSSRLGFPQPDYVLRALVDTAVARGVGPMAPEASRQARGVGLPYAECPIVTAAGEQLSIAAERHAARATGMPLQGRQQPAALRCPDSDRPVNASAG